jgi:hypothetical protein
MSKWNGQSLRVPNKCSRAQVTLLAEAGQCLVKRAYRKSAFTFR